MAELVIYIFKQVDIKHDRRQGPIEPLRPLYFTPSDIKHNRSTLASSNFLKGNLSGPVDDLEAAIDQDALAVREMLMGDGAPLDPQGQPTGVEGAATAIGRMLEVLTREGDPNDPVTQGMVFSRIESYDPRISELDSTIESMERRLAKREELLVAQFSQLEALAASLQAQGSFLSSAFAQLNANQN